VTAVLYATRADLYKYGLPRGMLSLSAREVASSLASNDTITLDDHGFADGDAIVFRAAEGGTLSAPLVAGTTYYVKSSTDISFQVSATSGGSAINLTTDGTNVLVASSLPYDDVIEFYSRWAEGYLPAHSVPLAKNSDGKYPMLVVGIVAQLAAKKLMQLAGHVSESVNDFQDQCAKELERYAKGLTLRVEAPNQKPANLAASASLVSSGTDERGWGSRCLP
jgi:hypothetical protein